MEEKRYSSVLYTGEQVHFQIVQVVFIKRVVAHSQNFHFQVHESK